MWVCATGARHSKSLERRCPRTVCLLRGPKIINSYYTRCTLIRDRQQTAWDGFPRSAETEATCIRKISPQIVVERFLKVCIMSVRGSFCEKSEESEDYSVVARWQKEFRQ